MKRLLAFFAILLILGCVVFDPRLILAAMLWMIWMIAGDIIEYIEMKERRKCRLKGTTNAKNK